MWAAHSQDCTAPPRAWGVGIEWQLATKSEVGGVRHAVRIAVTAHGARAAQTVRVNGRLTTRSFSKQADISVPRFHNSGSAVDRIVAPPGISERKLMDCLTLLGRDTDIVVRATPKRKGQGAVPVSKSLHGETPTIP
jgi:hypothetical protein